MLKRKRKFLEITTVVLACVVLILTLLGIFKSDTRFFYSFVVIGIFTISACMVILTDYVARVMFMFYDILQIFALMRMKEITSILKEISDAESEPEQQ